MVCPDGSAAVASPATPESAVIECRARLRAELPSQLDRIEHTLRLARLALTGPDPEVALEYLGALSDRARSVVSSYQ